MRLSILLIYCSFLLPLYGFSQYEQLNEWLEDNAEAMGGRVFLVIYKDGKLIYSQGANEMTARQKRIGKFIAKRKGKTADLNDFTLNTREPIASCSKWLSAALVMRFIDAGKLQLQDSIGKYLPIFTRYGKGNITIIQCLSHTTGIKPPDLKANLKEMRQLKSMEECMQYFAQMPMEGNAGTVFRYSNAGLQIAAAVLEKISGKDFETLFEEEIARPLGLRNTDFGKSGIPLAAGGAFSTPEDYISFLNMILNKGMYKGNRILSEASVAAMQVNRITNGVRVAYAPAEAGNFGYGFGEWVMTTAEAGKPSNAVTSPGLFGSFPWVDNQLHYAAFLMTVNLKSKGRHEKYVELKQLVDSLLK